MRGSSVSAQRTPPSSSRTRLRGWLNSGPDPRQDHGRSRRNRLSSRPGNAPSLSAPERPLQPRFRLSRRCFVSDENSRPTEQVVLGPAQEASTVSFRPPQRWPQTRKRMELPAERSDGESWGLQLV
ncbi:hypothetical protein STEG23_022764 [Scotinomys teguina]